MKQEEFGFAKVMDISKHLEELVDVCVGPMRCVESGAELVNYITRKNPEYLVVEMKNIGKHLYLTSIYMTEEDFQKI